MDFSPHAVAMQPRSSTAQADRVVQEPFTLPSSSAYSNQASDELSFNGEHVPSPGGQLVESFSCEGLHAFVGNVCYGIRFNGEETCEDGADVSSRIRQPFRDYLSPVSLAESPSTASEKMSMQESDQIQTWTMSSDQDDDGNLNYLLSSPASLRAKGDDDGGLDQQRREGLSARQLIGTSSQWSRQDCTQRPMHPSCFEPEGASFGHGFDHQQQHMSSVPSAWLSFAPANIILGSAIPSQSQSQNHFHLAPQGETWQNQVETHSFVDAPGPSIPSQAGRESTRRDAATLPKKSTSCKSCKKTFSSQLEWDLHERECEGLSCLFSFAGCGSRCKGKNEWKRHIYTQHLPTRVFKCPQCPSKVFNRKDLFTQHYLRMHATKHEREAAAAKQSLPGFEQKLREKQMEAESVNILRLPDAPKCFVPDCQHIFSSPDSWGRCLEHVSKHLETEAETNPGVGRRLQFTAEQYKYFQDIGAIESDGSGQWTLGSQSNGERARINKKKTGTRRPREPRPSRDKRTRPNK